MQSLDMVKVHLSWPAQMVTIFLLILIQLNWKFVNLFINTGSVDIAKILIENGADVNMADTDGTTPILVAALKGIFWLVVYLFIIHNFICTFCIWFFFLVYFNKVTQIWLNFWLIIMRMSTPNIAHISSKHHYTLLQNMVCPLTYKMIFFYFYFKWDFPTIVSNTQ